MQTFLELENIRLKILALESTTNRTTSTVGSPHSQSQSNKISTHHFVSSANNSNFNESNADYEYDIHIPEIVPELPDDIKVSSIKRLETNQCSVCTLKV